MTSLRNRQVLLILGVLLFAIGHSHQVMGRLYAHNHETTVVDGHNHDDSSSHHSSDEEQQKNADHMMEHATVVAVVPAVVLPALGELHVIGCVPSAAAQTAEPLPAGIDHPPQLA